MELYKCKDIQLSLKTRHSHPATFYQVLKKVLKIFVITTELLSSCFVDFPRKLWRLENFQTIWIKFLKKKENLMSFFFLNMGKKYTHRKSEHISGGKSQANFASWIDEENIKLLWKFPLINFLSVNFDLVVISA